MKAPRPQWDWEAARQLKDETRDRLFVSWVNDQLEAKRRAWEESFDPAIEFAHESDPKLAAELTRQLRVEAAAPLIIQALNIKDRHERIATLTNLIRDKASLQFCFERIWKNRGGQAGRIINNRRGKPQREYTDDEREMLREMASDVRTIRLLLRQNHIRKPRVPAEDIAVERAMGNAEGWDPKQRRARRNKLIRDLVNYMKNR